MPTEFTVSLADAPGSLPGLGRVLGDARVNIEAILGLTLERKGHVRFVPNDPAQAAHALDAAGIVYTRRDVLLVRILNEPGTLGEVALVMARAGVNIDTVYVTMRGQVVLGVDDLAGATQVAGGMAVMAPE